LNPKALAKIAALFLFPNLFHQPPNQIKLALFALGDFGAFDFDDSI